ncbi:MAG TPA: YeeE/YedE thiosulfate transporter family protein [Opitutaceae bacterium]|nr:YeeE/YedE thiosulfate transporter family protein [Opitutaceae bacterium]
MSAPFYKFGLFGDETSLIVAFVTGIAFGFFLERAGFGNARLLAAQFYFRDLRVLKVMFTAIITAMVGLYVFSRLGLLDLSLVYLVPTLVWPQIVGGLLLGAGFIIGGYCPGTSCVSAATGRLDGMVYVAGMVGGLLGFAEVYPRIVGFAKSTPLGQVTIPQYFDLPYGLLVLLVVLMALAAFAAAEWAEHRIGGHAPDENALTSRSPRLNTIRRLGVVLVAGGVFATFAGSPYRGPFVRYDAKQLALDAGGKTDRVSPAQLADWLIAGRTDFVLVDVRDAAAYGRYHVPGAMNVPLATLTPDFAAHNERVICYGSGDGDGAQAALVLRSFGFPGAYAITGGVEAWQADVLFPTAPNAKAPAAEQIDFARRAAIARHFGGAPRDGSGAATPATPEMPKIVPMPESAAPAAPAPVRKKKEGC